MGVESSGPLAGLRVLEVAQFAAGLLRSITLPGGRKMQAVANPLRLTDYTFQVVRLPPGPGEHDEDVFRDWLS